MQMRILLKYRKHWRERQVNIFKEWNTKEDGTGETYKPGDSIKKLLETADMAKQAQETSERTEAGEEIKPEKDVMQEENDVAQTDSASMGRKNW